MKLLRLTTLMIVAISLATAQAQEARPAAAAVEGIKGIKEDAVEKVKRVETGTTAKSGGVPTGTQNRAQGVNKIDGVETIQGVKADGRAVSPVAPPPIVSAGGTAVPAGGGAIGSAADIRAVKGVGGIDTAKLQNLEAALVLKEGGGETPAGGAENGSGGKSAAAALLAVPMGESASPKGDGRAGFQEFEKLQNNGS